jgi:transposase
VPFGVLMLLTGALTLVFGSSETSDFWADGLKLWWESVRAGCRGVRRLVLYLDNGLNNSGRRTQFLKRMVEFADYSGLELRLVYYPPYHSKYNPIERCWAALEKKWNGVLLNCWEVIRACALRMTWRGRHPTVKRLTKTYAKKVSPSAAEMKGINTRLERSATLPNYDITITPKLPRGG